MTEYRQQIESAAASNALDPNLVEAIILQESIGFTWAWNPEPRYHYLWDVLLHKPFRPLSASESLSETPPDDFPTLGGDRDQEWWGQQASWGLMQIMGAVAREHGFVGIYLTRLCDPAVNLRIGCAHLARLLAWSNGDVAKAAGAYNAGRGGWNSPAGVKYANSVSKLHASVKLANGATT